MKQKKHAHMVLVVIILIGAFLIIRSAIVGQIRNNIKDADYEEDALTAQAGCTLSLPAGVSVNASSTSATVVWTTNQLSTSQVKLGAASNGTSGMIWLTAMDVPASTNGVTSHSYLLSNLTPGSVYSYRVRSSNGSCQKTSPIYSFTTLASGSNNADITPPSIPTFLPAAPITSTSVTLNWNTSSDTAVGNQVVSGVKNYEVYGPTGACNAPYYNGLPSAGFCGFVADTGVASYSFQVNGLSPSTTYNQTTGLLAGFAIVVFDNAGNHASTLPTPTSPRFSVTTLATGQTVDVCPNIAGSQAAVPAGMIINGNGDCVTPADIIAPSAPTALVSPAHSTNSISLSWTAATDNIGVTGYKVYMNGGANSIASPAGTTYTVTGLATATA